MIPYPTTLPVEDLQTIVTSVRAGNNPANRAKFGKACWELAGYALLMSVGDTTGPTPTGFFGAEAPLTDEQAVHHLEQLAAPAGRIMATGPVPWVPLLKWALTTLAAAL